MQDSKRDPDINNSLLDSGRRRRWDDLREWLRNMYSIIHETDRPYVKQIAGPGLMHETGCSGLVHWDDPEGWDGQGVTGWGTYVHPWLIHVSVWQKPLQYCKVISLQLK